MPSRLGSAASADAYLRVIAQQAPVHSGPSGNYRTVFVADAKRQNDPDHTVFTYYEVL